MKRTLSVLLLALALLGNGRADEATATTFVNDYVAAFNKKDAAQVMSMWSETAQFSDLTTGEQNEGRAAIGADISAAFKEHPDAQLSARVTRTRKVKPDVLRIHGETTLRIPEQEAVVSHFSALLIQTDGKWLLDSLEQTDVPAPQSPYDALKELEWLIGGQWVDDADPARVTASFQWSPSKVFLIRSFAVEEEGEVIQQGSQIIGWDPRDQVIRSWSFQSDGAFGEAVWSRNDRDWLIKSSQVLASGESASGTYVLTPVDKDTIALKLLGHEVEGEPRPTTPPAKMVRVALTAKPEPAKPVIPRKTAIPAKPATPGKSAVSGKPARPAKPATPNESTKTGGTP